MLPLILCHRARMSLHLISTEDDSLVWGLASSEDADYLVRAQALASDRIRGVETGGCPHTAIREDASINLRAVEQMVERLGALDIVFVESGGDNLSATFSPELADITIYVIDVSAGEKIPRKGGPGITRSDLLVINKTDLAEMVGASLTVMDEDAKRMRAVGFGGTRPVRKNDTPANRKKNRRVELLFHRVKGKRTSRAY